MVIKNLDKLYFVAKCVLINNENKFLILKRSNYQNNHTDGLWDLPGGNVDLYEDVNIAIKREVKEELQVVLNKAEVFGIDSCKHFKEESQVIFVLFSSRDFDMINNEIVLSEEHSEHKWIYLDELDNSNFHLTKERVEKIRNHLKSLE